MRELLMTRRGSTLVPADHLSAETLSNVPANQIVTVVIKARRNPKQHALAWALAAKIAEGTGTLADAEIAMDYLLIKCRHTKTVVDPRTGIVDLVPKSISFGSLDQLAFQRLFDRMIFVITDEILPHIKSPALRREIEKMIEGKWNDEPARNR